MHTGDMSQETDGFDSISSPKEEVFPFGVYFPFEPSVDNTSKFPSEMEQASPI